MKIQIGNKRVVTLKRTPEGEWIGEGHGLRFRLSRVYGRNMGWSDSWRCRVFRGGPTRGALLASCRSHTMKHATQEGARLADLELEILRIAADAMEILRAADAPHPLYERYRDDCDAKNRE